MAEAALKAGLWVQVQIKICDENALPVVVVQCDDPNAGAILLKLKRFDAGYEVLTQVRTAEGNRAWMRSTGDNPVQETAADAYIERNFSSIRISGWSRSRISNIATRLTARLSEPLFGAVDQVVAEIGLYRIAYGVDVEAECDLLEFRNHISAFE